MPTEDAPSPPDAFAGAWALLERHGLVLESDPHLPSVASLVAGEPLRGSWWGHPRGHEIFAVTRRLAEHRDVVTVKLVSAKVTHVHRTLWPFLLGVAGSGEPWQLEELPLAARAVLSAVQRSGSARADELPGSALLRKPAVKELERRLLVHVDELHSEKGSHVKVLETWERWAERAKAPKRRVAAPRARRTFDDLVRSLNILCNGEGTLPWWTEV